MERNIKVKDPGWWSGEGGNRRPFPVVLFTWNLMHLGGLRIIRIICNRSPTTTKRHPLLLLLSLPLIPLLPLRPSTPLLPRRVFFESLWQVSFSRYWPLDRLPRFPPCYCGQPFSGSSDFRPALTVTLLGPVSPSSELNHPSCSHQAPT